MRYAPPGMCLNDFAVLDGDGGWHVLHLQGPATYPFDASAMESSFGHAFSRDLIHWEPRGAVFGIGRPEEFDGSAIWTMSTVTVGNRLWMFYTGVRNRPHHEQSIGLAVSERADGTGWTRAADGPIVRADPRWYVAAGSEGMAWRDPFVVWDHETDQWVMVVCARDRRLPLARGGCVGVATSRNLITWQVLPPLLVPGAVDEVECPVLEPAADGGWYLFLSISPQRQIEVWHSPSLLQRRWRRLGPLTAPGPYAPRLLQGRDGSRLLLHTLPRRSGLRDDGELVRGVLAQPKLFLETPWAGVHLGWWPGQEDVLGAASLDGHLRDGSVEVRVPAGASRVRIVAREAPGHVAFIVVVTDEEVVAGYDDGTTLQRAVSNGNVGHIRLLLVGEYLEVYCDDRLVISTLGYAPRAGAVRATADGSPLIPLVRPLVPNGARRDDVSAVWTGTADV